MRLHIALVHYPVLDRTGHTVTSSVTNLDIHDFARTALTFEVERAYMVTPVTQQRDMVHYVRDTWLERVDADRAQIRSQALSLLSALPSVAAVQEDILSKTGLKPYTITTSAAPTDEAMGYDEASKLMSTTDKPALILFGTGWGLAPELHEAANARLQPLRAGANYNHLPVRAAVAMTLDRLMPEQATASGQS